LVHTGPDPPSRLTGLIAFYNRTPVARSVIVFVNLVTKTSHDIITEKPAVLFIYIDYPQVHILYADAVFDCGENLVFESLGE
jgi:hypothetical protein